MQDGTVGVGSTDAPTDPASCCLLARGGVGMRQLRALERRLTADDCWGCVLQTRRGRLPTNRQDLGRYATRFGVCIRVPKSKQWTVQPNETLETGRLC